MEKKMETIGIIRVIWGSFIFRDYMGNLEKNMETAEMGYLGLL